jgi:hypothetical protein
MALRWLLELRCETGDERRIAGATVIGLCDAAGCGG